MSTSNASRRRRPAPGGSLPRGAAETGFGRRFVVATSAGSVLNPINSSIIAVALVAVGRSFGVSAATTTWLVSALYLATAAGQPFMGRLADQLGPRRVYLAGLALVAAGGLAGWLAPSLGVLVAARVILGLGTSAAYPAAMAMVRRQAHRLRRDPPGSVLGALAVAGQATMAVGPPLGGLLIAVGGWRLTLLINIPLAAAGAVFALAWLPTDEPARLRLAALDLPGAGLFTATLTALLVFVMNLRAHPWWLLATAAVLGAALARRELAARSPFLDVRMLAHNRALTTTYLRFGLTMLVTYCFIYGWTLWLEQAAGKTASAAGLLMLPSFAAAAGVSALAARSRRIWPPLAAGAVTLTAGSASLLALHGHSPVWILAAVSVIFGVQNGLSVVTNQAAMYAQAPAAQTGTAAGLLRTSVSRGDRVRRDHRVRVRCPRHRRRAAPPRGDPHDYLRRPARRHRRRPRPAPRGDASPGKARRHHQARPASDASRSSHDDRPDRRRVTSPCTDGASHEAHQAGAPAGRPHRSGRHGDVRRLHRRGHR